MKEIESNAAIHKIIEICENIKIEKPEDKMLKDVIMWMALDNKLIRYFYSFCIKSNMHT